MGEEHPSTERKRNIWAPWRIEYINDLDAASDEGCFLCRYRDDPANDESNLVIWRGARCFTVLNRYPYTGGHSMVAPFDHVANLSDLDPPTMLEILEMVRDVQELLTRSIHAQGFNVGMNFGRVAGAGLPEHLHVHVVPRWSGDTNFISVLGEVRVVPQMLQDLYAQLQQTSGELKLPRLSK
ncbi:MAG: HIT family protein [Planctomycetota bacterium]|jgi:ATP adenylyltransferase